MYARRQTRPKPRTSEMHKWAAPVAGWIANRALASPQSVDGPGAAVLDNFFPRSTGVSLRRGKQLYATLEDTTLPVTSLFTYQNGTNRHLFAANETTIYDITSILFPDGGEVVTDLGDLIVTDGGDWFGWSSTVGLNIMGGMTGGNWITVQFASTGGIFLIGVNGEDTGFIYDGTTFLPYPEGGVWSLGYDALVVPLVVGETLTGGTSGATGEVVAVDVVSPTTGIVYLTNVTGGPFDDNEALTDTGGGSATAEGVEEEIYTGITFGTSGLTTADMSFVWAYKNRIFFIQKDSLSVWYLGIDSIGGMATEFPMGGIFSDGGSLLFGQKWSMDTSGDGGLSEQCVFVTTNGEVAVFQGDNPGNAVTWNKVGVYRIGTPLGNRAFIRGGGDLAIATSVGLVPLSKAITLDVTALNVATVSYKIADAWSDALVQRGRTGWQAFLWPEGKMAMIGLPDTIGGSSPSIFVSNTDGGAWCRFTGWQAYSFETFDGLLYFGSTNGRIYIGNVSGTDDGETYTGTVIPLFEDMGTAASAKIGTVARARVRANMRVNDQITMMVNFNMTPPAAPDAAPLTSDNLWGTGTWGTSLWGEVTPTVIVQPWRSAGGIGYSISTCYQVTSGGVNPLDVEIIDTELLYTTAEFVT